MIVIEGVPGRIVLRAGKDLATIEHLGAGAAPPLAAAAREKVERP
jgi:hypothetical protein